MAATGYIQVYAFTGTARLPLRDVAVTVTDENNSAIFMGLTDKSGKLNLVTVTVPDRSDSLTPNTSVRPYATVNIHARLENFEQIEADNVQVFADTVTIQNLEMIPLSELPDQWTKSEIFDTPGQNL